MSSDKWLSPADVAALPWVFKKPATVTRHARNYKNGETPALRGEQDKVSGFWRFRLSWVEAAYREPRVNPDDVTALINAEMNRLRLRA